MRICELREKEVINVCDGQRLGFVEDVEFDICTGCIQKLIVPGPCKIMGILGRDHEYIIDFRQVKRVGCDVILVDINIKESLVKTKGLS